MSLEKINKILSIIENISSENILTAPPRGKMVPFPNNICIIGAGGTGSWFVPKLIKILNDARGKSLLSNPDDPENSGINNTVVFIDGDIVEEKNLIRQNFVKSDIGKNKAKVLSTRYNSQLDNTFFESGYIDKYIYSKNIQELTEEEEGYYIDIKTTPLFQNINHKRFLFINLVDNALARKTIHLLALQAKNGFVIDVANNEYNGQLTTSLYSNASGNNNSIDLIRSNFYNSLSSHLKFNDKVAIHSCADVDSESSDQLFNANDMAASILGNYINNWIVSSKLFYGLIEFVTGSNISINRENPFYNSTLLSNIDSVIINPESDQSLDGFGDKVLRAITSSEIDLSIGEISDYMDKEHCRYHGVIMDSIDE